MNKIILSLAAAVAVAGTMANVSAPAEAGYYYKTVCWTEKVWVNDYGYGYGYDYDNGHYEYIEKCAKKRYYKQSYYKPYYKSYGYKSYGHSSYGY